MTASRILVFFLVGLFTLPAVAGPTTRVPPTSTAPSAPVAPVFTCSIVPAAVPGPNEFQATSVTARLVRGTVDNNKQIEIRLGSQANGTLLGHACTDNLDNRRVTKTVTIAPPITNPNYNWACTAKQVSTSCPSAPH